MNLLSVVLLGTGGLLIYSSVKGYDPRDVIKSALSGQNPSATVTKAYDLGLDSYAGNPASDRAPRASGV